MKILMAHNFYQQVGGEDQSFLAESALLETYGNKVIRYILHNNQIHNMKKLTLSGSVFWNPQVYRDLRLLIRQERPSVAHFQNIFPLISPSSYFATKAEGIPIIQTLRNYRLLCPNALFFRDGHVCEDCLGRFIPWPGVVYRCYRGSIAASGAVAAMLTVHRALGTWSRMVDVYIALTEFARQKFIEAGFPAEKIVVKPNFVYPDPGTGEGKGGFALFVGRLSPEKGLSTLLKAWELLKGMVPLKIAGDGPMAERVAEATRQIPGVEWVGQKSIDDIYTLMGESSLVIVPSEWYETFGRVVIEAFAKGTPVLVSNIGALAELVDSGRTGLHFLPGAPEDLAAKVEWAWTHPRQLAEMRREARAEYEAKYTAEKNYEMLMDIYQLAISRAKGRY